MVGVMFLLLLVEMEVNGVVILLLLPAAATKADGLLLLLLLLLLAVATCRDGVEGILLLVEVMR